MSKNFNIKTDRWPMYKLGNPDISHIILGQSPRSSTYNKEGKGIPFLQGKTEFGEIYPDFKLFCSDPIKIALEADILLSVRAPVGDLNIASRKCCIGRGLAAIRPNKAALYHLYLFYLLKLYKSFIDSISTGSTFKAIKKSDIENLEISLPPLPEQKKIAEILSTVDLASEKVINALKKNEIIFYGLLKYLFQNNIKNWGNETLENLSNSIVGGGTPSTSKSEFWNGNIAWMTSAHISNRDIVNGQKYITNTGLEKSSSKLVTKNNIIIATRVGIGKVALNKIDVAISQDLTGIVLEHDKIAPDFLYYFFLTQKNKLKALAQGSTIKGILREDISKLNIPLPSLSIQKKIVAILNSFYEKQELLNKKKEKLTSIKKGLMNDLLTGQKRVRLES